MRNSGSVPSAGWIVLIFIVILGLLLPKTSFGRYVVASGGNAEAARWPVSGSTKFASTFAVSASAAGLGGVIDTSDYSALSPPAVVPT